MVGGEHERGRVGSVGECQPHGVGRAVPPRLADVCDGDAERGAVAEQRLDLVGQVSGDDGHAVAARRTEPAHECRDHGAPVDREHGLRPALGEGPQARSLARGHDDRLDQPAKPNDRSDTRPRARRTRPSRRRS